MMQPGLLTICIEMKNTTFDGEHASNTKEKLRPTWKEDKISVKF